VGATVSVMVQEAVPAPVTDAGVQDRADTCGGADNAIDAVFWLLLTAAVITAVKLALTAVMVTEKVVVVDPAGTVTVVGTEALVVLLERLTARLAVGAGARVIVQETVPAPVIDADVQDRADTWGGADNAIDAVFWVLLSVAVTVAVKLAVTAAIWAEKVAEADPAGIVTVAGTETLVVLLERLTARLAVGAPLRVTVQEAVPAALKVAGEQVRPVSAVAGAKMLTAFPVEDCKMVTVPAVPVVETASPTALAVMVPLTWIGVEAAVAVGERVTAT
jgi:hypothetical protein